MDPSSRWISLLWAAPFMLFLAIPLVHAVHDMRGTTSGNTIIGMTLLLAATYVGTWLVNPVAPRGGGPTRAFVLSFGALILVSAGWLALPHLIDVTSAGYMLSYLMAAWCMQSPRRFAFPGFWAILTISVLTTFLLRTDEFYVILTVGLTGIVCSLSRMSIDHGDAERLDQQRALELSEERERARLSADLHDILGQTLTAITVKADLAGRLMDAGRTPEARSEVDDLQDMARQALADVRQVVASTRILQPDSEVASARSLLEAAGVNLDVTDEGGEPAPGAPATLVAHTIREATTNALAHSDCRNVWIRLGAGGVEVVNDGCRGRSATPLRPRSHASGSGLAGLRERAEGLGTLTWGHDPGRPERWQLILRLDAAR